MERRNVAFGTILIIIGILLTFIGSLSIIGYVIFAHFGNHLRYLSLAYVSNFIIETWGIGLLICGIVIAVFASGVFQIRRRSKIAFLSVGIASLVIGASLSGIIILGSLPPSERLSVLGFTTTSDIYEVNASAPAVHFSLYSLYSAEVSLNYTHSGKVISNCENSFSGFYNSSSQPPVVAFSGTINATLTVWSGSIRIVRSIDETVFPQLKVLNISGPQCINDSSGAVLASYVPIFIGGVGPFNFTWYLYDLSFTDIQNSSCSSLYGETLNVTYFENPTNQYSFGYNGSYDLMLTITDSAGMRSSYESHGSQYFAIVVKGN